PHRHAPQQRGEGMSRRRLRARGRAERCHGYEDESSHYPYDTLEAAKVDYSALNAPDGSTLAARRAGNRAAIVATAPSARTPSTMLAGSADPTPKSRSAITRPAAN